MDDNRARASSWGACRARARQLDAAAALIGGEFRIGPGKTEFQGRGARTAHPIPLGRADILPCESHQGLGIPFDAGQTMSLLMKQVEQRGDATWRSLLVSFDLLGFPITAPRMLWRRTLADQG